MGIALGNGGAYAFRLQQTTVTPITLGTPYNGTLVGNSQAQLFTVPVTTAGPLLITFRDPTTTDQTELYASFGVPPTRQTYDYGDTSSGADHQLLVPNAYTRTWYVLVYSDYVATSAAITLTVSSSDIVLADVTPNSSVTNATTTLTLTGAGFQTGSTVQLLSGQTSYHATTSTVNLPTQITATFAAGSVPAGTYTIQVERSDGVSAQLANALMIIQNGEPDLHTQLIMPAHMGYHVSSTIYVQYSNTGAVAMPAPVILLESSLPQDIPFLTLDASLQVSGFRTSAQPLGYSPTVEILAGGKIPGVLEPGESITVPVYYAGLEQPWSYPLQSSFEYDLRIFTTADSDPVDWTSYSQILWMAMTT